MPIISAEVIDKKNYRIAIALGHGVIENIVITSDGLYSIYYIKHGQGINNTGRILNVVQNKAIPQNSYILFDWSGDNSNRRERINFHQIQFIKDITPNNAYQIAIDHGFVGTVEDWLESMRGYPGKDNYEIAVECGYTGTREQWVEESRGTQGYSAYEIARKHGFNGTEEEWLESLKGKNGEPGKNAYELAVENGYEGTLDEWLASVQGADGKSAYEIAVEYGFKGTEEEWIESLKGGNGKSAYDIAVDYGFKGTEEEWLNSLKGTDGKSAYEIAIAHGFEGTEEEWFAKNGDVTLLQQQMDTVEERVGAVETAITWKSEMDETEEDV